MQADGGDDRARELIERAVAIIQRTNSCDAVAAREILRSTAVRNRLDESDVATTLVALSAAPRRSSRVF